jgi:pilus assembly protein CpaE
VETTRILVADRSDALGNAVQHAASALRQPNEIDLCNRVTELPDVVTGSGPFDVLIAGTSLISRTGLARVTELHDAQPSITVLLVAPQQVDVHIADVVRTGAIDILAAPVRQGTLVEALERAIDRHHLLSPLSATALNGPAPDGATFTVASATGGCGKTFYATNLAYFLAHHTRRRVCIADFDLQFGEVSTALRLRPKYTSFDLVEQLDDEALDDHIEEYLVPHGTGVSVLAAPKDPTEADRFSPNDVTRILDALRRRFDYVVVDTPAQLSEVVLAAFDRSDVLFTLATLDLPSVRNMGVFLTTLQRLKIPSDNVRLILNKEESNVGIEVDQVAKLFPQGFSSVLPYSREVSRSINLGMPVMAASPGTDVSRRLADGMMPLLPAGVEVPSLAVPSEKRSFADRLLRRSSRPVVAEVMS